MEQTKESECFKILQRRQKRRKNRLIHMNLLNESIFLTFKIYENFLLLTNKAVIKLKIQKNFHKFSKFKNRCKFT